MYSDKAKILIAEDEFIVALDIKNILTTAGYNVTSVSSTGEDTIRKAEIERPDLLLIDITLKGEINGIEASEIISGSFKLPILFLAVMEDKKTRELIEKYNCQLIIKPFEEPLLLKTIDSMLKAKRRND